MNFLIHIITSSYFKRTVDFLFILKNDEKLVSLVEMKAKSINWNIDAFYRPFWRGIFMIILVWSGTLIDLWTFISGLWAKNSQGYCLLKSTKHSRDIRYTDEINRSL